MIGGLASAVLVADGLYEAATNGDHLVPVVVPTITGAINSWATTPRFLALSGLVLYALWAVYLLYGIRKYTVRQRVPRITAVDANLGTLDYVDALSPAFAQFRKTLVDDIEDLPKMNAPLVEFILKINDELKRPGGADTKAVDSLHQAAIAQLRQSSKRLSGRIAAFLDHAAVMAECIEATATDTARQVGLPMRALESASDMYSTLCEMCRWTAQTFRFQRVGVLKVARDLSGRADLNRLLDDLTRVAETRARSYERIASAAEESLRLVQAAVDQRGQSDKPPGRSALQAGPAQCEQGSDTPAQLPADTPAGDRGLGM